MTAPARAPGRVRRVVRSVRFRVTALATLVTFLVLVVAGFALVAAQRSQLTAGVDRSLAQAADDLADQAERGTFATELPDLLDDDAVAQVVAADGTVLAASEDLAGAPAIAPAPADGDESATTITATWDDGDGDRWRVESRSVRADDGSDGSDDDGSDDGEDGGDGSDDDRQLVVHVALPVDEVAASTGALRSSLLVAVPGVSLVLAVLIWFVVGRMLRPVEAIRAEAAAIGGTDLHRRLPVPDSGDEIARLAATMNGLLGRVEAATARQQRFVADASHDLRSPLTRMRTELEVDLARPDAADPLATHRSLLDETIGLQRLVDDLLYLARSDEGAPPPTQVAVDLDDVLLAEARRLRALGGPAVDSTRVAAGQVVGDAGQLARVVANLGDNAHRFARTTVALSLEEQPDAVVLTVADDGPGIPPDQHEAVFERFARVDEARDAARGGAGLGLAIARDIVTRHGGQLWVDPSFTPGTRLVARFPRSG